MATLSSSQIETFGSEVNDRAIGATGNAQYGGGGGKGGGGDSYALTIFGKPIRETNCDCERTTDPTLLQTIYTRNDPTFLSRLEGGRAGAWIEELRRAAAPRGEKNPASIREMIAKMDEKFAAKFAVPKKPDTSDAEGQAQYERARGEYEQRVAELKTRKAELQKDLAEAEKVPVKFDLDAVIRQVFLRTVSRPPTAEEFAQAKGDVSAAKIPIDGVRDLLWAMLNTREFMVNH